MAFALVWGRLLRAELPYSGVSELGCLPGRPGWPFSQVRPNILTGAVGLDSVLL